WSYIDRDTSELRSIDLCVELRLHGWEPQPRVRPCLNLLIECKQSTMPFVFFEACNQGGEFRDFPVIAGLRSDKIIVKTDDDPSSWIFPICTALELDEDDFYLDPTVSHTLSKCVRKGAELELSGTDAYNSMVLPLVKATQHFRHSEHPIKTAQYFDLHLAVPIAVVDAPMASVGSNMELRTVEW